MEPTSKLTPQEGCSLAAVLFPEEFKTNKPRAIVRALLWLAEAVSGESALAQGLGSQIQVKDLLISRLEEVSKTRGLNEADLAKQLEIKV
jgi:hypothetical protein